MLEKMTIPGVELPRLYVASTNKDVELAMQNGFPFIVWKNGSKDLIKHMLRPALEKIFPYIKWNNVLGERSFKTKVVLVPSENITSHDDQHEYNHVDNEVDHVEHDNDEVEHESFVEDGEETAFVTTEERLFGNDPTCSNLTKHSLEDYLGDVNSMVNIDVLQELKLIPKFLGDIVDCIRTNLVAPVHWTEGYNKKLGLALGTFSRTKQLPNLIILDVSGSIPRGISATMITLIDTLRTQLSAELIITSGLSKYFTLNDDLPSPEEIRNQFDFRNESCMFMNILKKYIAGREWGNVISFGDNDTPDYALYLDNYNHDNFLSDTKVHCVRHYHTGISYYAFESSDLYTGYAKWCTEYTKDKPEVIVDTSWCKVIYE